MVWLKDEPTTATKISQLATILTNNQNGIQNGEVPFVNLRLTSSSDPARNDNYSWVYGKDPGTSLIELFFEDNDNPAHVIQLTSGGNLGSVTTPLIGSQIALSSSLNYFDGQFVTAYGYFNNVGAFQYGRNMAANGSPHPGTGQFQVDVNADVLINANYIVVGIVFQGGLSSGTSAKSVNASILPAPVAATPTTLTIEVRQESGRADFPFMLMICGGR